MWPLYVEELNGPRRRVTVRDGLAARGFSKGGLQKRFGSIHDGLCQDGIGGFGGKGRRQALIAVGFD